MGISELLREENILMNISACSKEDILWQLVTNIENNLYSKKECYKDILKREEQVSTGLIHGIAIPHAQSKSVKRSTISIARIVNHIAWKTIDNSKVQVIILITVPIDSQGEHLKILASIAEKLMDEETCVALNKVKSKREIIEILEGKV